MMIFFGVCVIYFAVKWTLYARQAHALSHHYDQVPQGFEHSISLSQHQKAADYGLAKLRLARVELLMELALFVFWVVYGLPLLSDYFQGADGSLTLWDDLKCLLCVMGVGLLLELPLELHRTFKLEARFGFNQTTFSLFIKDQLLSLALTAVLGIPLLWFVLWAMHSLGHHWWWVAYLGLTSFSLLMTLIWPNYIAPLFNQFKELDHPEVRESINALLKDVGFKSSGVYVMDGSKRSTHGNAYFTGFGSTKRIVLFDTLMERLTSSEIRAVLAHELGHFKLNHIRKGLILNLIIMGLGFWVLGQLSQNEAFFQALHLPVRPAVVLILCIQGVSVISWPLGPLMNALSRAHEFEADAYAARHAPANDLIVALTKLVKDNASTLTPDRWYSRFFASHPTVTERIAALKTTP